MAGEIGCWVIRLRGCVLCGQRPGSSQSDNQKADWMREKGPVKIKTIKMDKGGVMFNSWLGRYGKI